MSLSYPPTSAARSGALACGSSSSATISKSMTPPPGRALACTPSILAVPSRGSIHATWPVGDDIMLNYQSTSYHDIPSVRRLLGKRPTPEFDGWLCKRGILDGTEPGPNFGDVRVLK